MRALGDSTPRRLPGTKWTIPSTQPVGMQKDKGLCSSSASQTSYRISHPPLPARDSERGGRVGTRGILNHETEEDRPECSAGGSSPGVGTRNWASSFRRPSLSSYQETLP